eukprot:scaffold251168_cov30-Tisochrysis_lutea.AAC.3
MNGDKTRLASGQKNHMGYVADIIIWDITVRNRTRCTARQRRLRLPARRARNGNPRAPAKAGAAQDGESARKIGNGIALLLQRAASSVAFSVVRPLKGAIFRQL